ncbi:ferredoxin [Streptomyces lydicus]|uniref:ferredoxin n=1 Tax=Streptomyces lydicus TaxID=47763 RepID=UPI0034261E53
MLMKVYVDPALCQGHNRCIVLAPALFTADEEGFASAIGAGTVPAEQAEFAELAVDNCPEQAISIVHEA